jgi:hypothetical protein
MVTANVMVSLVLKKKQIAQWEIQAGTGERGSEKTDPAAAEDSRRSNGRPRSPKSVSKSDRLHDKQFMVLIRIETSTFSAFEIRHDLKLCARSERVEIGMLVNTNRAAPNH